MVPLRTKHVVVDHQRLLIAEQACEVTWAVLGLETMVTTENRAFDAVPAVQRLSRIPDDHRSEAPLVRQQLPIRRVEDHHLLDVGDMEERIS